MTFPAEPPATGVSNFVAVAEFTTVTLTWDAVEGATNYNVAWRSAGGDDWTAVSSCFLSKFLRVDFEGEIDDIGLTS